MNSVVKTPPIAPPPTKREQLQGVLLRLMQLCQNYQITENADSVSIEATFCKSILEDARK